MTHRLVPAFASHNTLAQTALCFVILLPRVPHMEVVLPPLGCVNVTRITMETIAADFAMQTLVVVMVSLFAEPVFVYMYVFVFFCVHVCVYLCASVCVYVYVYACVGNEFPTAACMYPLPEASHINQPGRHGRGNSVSLPLMLWLSSLVIPSVPQVPVTRQQVNASVRRPTMGRTVMCFVTQHKRVTGMVCDSRIVPSCSFFSLCGDVRGVIPLLVLFLVSVQEPVTAWDTVFAKSTSSLPIAALSVRLEQLAATRVCACWTGPAAVSPTSSLRTVLFTAKLPPRVLPTVRMQTPCR